MFDPWLGNHMSHSMHGVAKKREKSKKEEKEGKKEKSLVFWLLLLHKKLSPNKTGQQPLNCASL